MFSFRWNFPNRSCALWPSKRAVCMQILNAFRQRAPALLNTHHLPGRQSEQLFYLFGHVLPGSCLLSSLLKSKSDSWYNVNWQKTLALGVRICELLMKSVSTVPLISWLGVNKFLNHTGRYIRHPENEGDCARVF